MSEIKSVVFVSNFFNHHQKFLSDEFYKTLGNGYKFIATMPMTNARKALGWKEYDMDYILYSYKSDEAYNECVEIINNADAVIIGSAPEAMIRRRIRSGKLTFRYSERFLRDGLELKKFLYRLVKFRFNNPMNKPVYLLCSSAYTSADYAKFGLFKNRAFKWAYFTEAKEYENIKELIAQKKRTEIVWCGRFLPLKHLEYAVSAVGRLVNEGYDCSLTVIGKGKDVKFYQTLAESISDKKYLNFLGSLSSDEVRGVMEKAGIFLFTSDFHEGWGAVVNEAMNSACAVVSSHAAGSTPFLIKDGVNGFIYENGNINELYEKIKYLLDNEDIQEKIAVNSYRTITELWSPKVAAERFLKLSSAILDGEKTDIFDNGPCSPSLPLKNDWYSSTKAEH